MLSDIRMLLKTLVLIQIWTQEEKRAMPVEYNGTPRSCVVQIAKLTK